MHKSYKLVLSNVKDPDGFQDLVSYLSGDDENLRDEISDEYLLWGEYTDLVMEVYLDDEKRLRFSGHFRKST